MVNAEACYRDRLLRHREWITERKADAETERKRQKEGAERKARELQEKARERIERLLLQAKALGRANQIRAYVEATLIWAAEMPICGPARRQLRLLKITVRSRYYGRAFRIKAMLLALPRKFAICLRVRIRIQIQYGS